MAGRCLVIDPSAMVRRVSTRILRELGFEVTEARSAVEALDSCRTVLPDVVLLDWQLDAENGLDALSFIDALNELSETSRRPAIIFCSAERSVERIVEALKAGATEYIMKPFDSDVIESKFAIAGLLGEAGADTCAAP